MQLRLHAITRILVIMLACSLTTFGNIDRIFDSFGPINCEDEMARLDNLAIELQNEVDSSAYIFIYGGKRGTFRDEVRVRGARMKRYLIQSRGVDPDKVKLIDGGYRETFSVDVRIVPNGAVAHEASPTVAPKLVRFKKGKMPRYNEVGCFPGKYLSWQTDTKRTPVKE